MRANAAAAAVASKARKLPTLCEFQSACTLLSQGQRAKSSAVAAQLTAFRPVEVSVAVV